MKILLIITLLLTPGLAYADTLKSVKNQPKETKTYVLYQTEKRQTVDGTHVDVITGQDTVTKEWIERRIIDLNEAKANNIASLDAKLSELSDFLEQINIENQQ